MQSKQLAFALVGRLNTPSVYQALKEIAAFLQHSGHAVIYEDETAKDLSDKNLPSMKLSEIGEIASAAIVVGGDGTMLGISRQLAPYGVPLIGINHGRLGFMTDIPMDRAIPVLSEMLEGKFLSENRILLEGTVIREGLTIHKAVALNDIVVSRGAGPSMMELHVEVDGHFMCSQLSDGLIVATPTGSTAYALSVGGPMLHPNLNGIVLASIAPHSLSNRPIVVPDSSDIMIEIVDAQFPSIDFDSQTFTSIHNGDCIVIRRARHQVTFMHPIGWSYYDTLRDKLNWNESGST